jgi:hypothetical protein
VASMPRLKALTIACDAEGEGMIRYLKYTEMREDFEYVGVGTLRLKPDKETRLDFTPRDVLKKNQQAGTDVRAPQQPEIFYKHYGLSKAWAMMQEVGKGDVPALFAQSLSHIQGQVGPLFDRQRAVKKFLQGCKLPVFCRMLDLVRQAASPPPSSSSNELEAAFLSQWNMYHGGNPGDWASLPIPVRDLDVAKHGEAMVEESCELVLTFAGSPRRRGRIGEPYSNLLEL